MVTALVVLLGCAMFYLWQLRIRREVQVLTSPSIDLPVCQETEFAPTIQRATFLLLGLDFEPGRENTGVRSDTIIVFTYNLTQREAHLISIPRDSRVAIPGYGLDKINHAYAYGHAKGQGATLSSDTVSLFLEGVAIDYWLTLDAGALPKMLDYFGRLEVDIKSDIPDLGLKAGTQALDGAMLAQYLRWRYDGRGDIGRVHRQQDFLVNLMLQMHDGFPYLRIPLIYNDIRKAFSSNLQLPDIIFWTNEFRQFDLNNLHTHHVPGSFLNLNGISYWEVDQAALSEILAEVFPELQPNPK